MNKSTIYTESQMIDKTAKTGEIDGVLFTLISYTGFEMLNGILY